MGVKHLSAVLWSETTGNPDNGQVALGFALGSLCLNVVKRRRVFFHTPSYQSHSISCWGVRVLQSRDESGNQRLVGGMGVAGRRGETTELTLEKMQITRLLGLVPLYMHPSGC